jgi:hypothetical protein
MNDASRTPLRTKPYVHRWIEATGLDSSAYGRLKIPARPPLGAQRSNCVEMMQLGAMSRSNRHRETEILTGHHAIDRSKRWR